MVRLDSFAPALLVLHPMLSLQLNAFTNYPPANHVHLSLELPCLLLYLPCLRRGAAGGGGGGVVCTGHARAACDSMKGVDASDDFLFLFLPCQMRPLNKLCI